LSYFKTQNLKFSRYLRYTGSVNNT